jgi:hypothetical protein
VKIAAIALATFRETVRQPILYVLMGLAMGLVLLTGYLPMFTFSVLDDLKMVKDMAVSTSALVGLLLAIFAAVQVVTDEIEHWTVLTVLAKPVRRWEFVLGKFLGLGGFLAGAYTVMSVGFIALTWWGIHAQLRASANVYPEYLAAFWNQFAWPAADQLWRGFAMSFLHTLVLTAVAVALCLRLPMVLSVVTYFVVFVAGHLMQGLQDLAGQAGALLGGTARAAGVLLPDLETFNVAHEVGLGQLIAPGDLAWCALYATAYCGAMVALGVALFRRREVF